MKPIELYNRKTFEKTKELGYLKGFYYNHIPEIEDELWGLNNENVEIKYYKDHSFDGRRVWVLASVWYENEPVMIIQNAGREGDDHRKRFVTNKELYIKMVQYIMNLLLVDKDIDDICDENDDISGLASFYGYKLDGHFDTH